MRFIVLAASVLYVAGFECTERELDLFPVEEIVSLCSASNEASDISECLGPLVGKTVTEVCGDCAVDSLVALHDYPATCKKRCESGDEASCNQCVGYIGWAFEMNCTQ